jgi:hypothetical protein
MTIGNLLQINAKGPEDQYLYGVPKTTNFKKVFMQTTNFASDYYKISDNQFLGIDFGAVVKMKIPHIGDLIGGLYLEIKLQDIIRKQQFINIDDTFTFSPQFTSYINGVGFNIIEYAKLSINGVTIETLTGESIFISNELTNDISKKQSFYKMNRYFPDTFEIGDSNTKDVLCNLYLPFFFTKDPSVYLPMCSLFNSEIVLEIKFKPANKVLARRYNYNGSLLPGINGYDSSFGAPAIYEPYIEDINYGIEKIDLYMKSIYLDSRVLQQFRSNDLTYLIECTGIGNSETMSMTNLSQQVYTLPLTFSCPTRYIVWLVQREDVYNANQYDNFTYRFRSRYEDGIYVFSYYDHLIKTAQLLVENNEYSSINNPIFLSAVQQYENFGIGTDIGIYTLCFCLTPNSIENSGTINFSKISKKELRITLVEPVKYSIPSFGPGIGTDPPLNTPNILFRSYSSFYNIFIVKDGLGGILFKT